VQHCLSSSCISDPVFQYVTCHSRWVNYDENGEQRSASSLTEWEVSFVTFLIVSVKEGNCSIFKYCAATISGDLLVLPKVLGR